MRDDLGERPHEASCDFGDGGNFADLCAHYTAGEDVCVQRLMSQLVLGADQRSAMGAHAAELIAHIRADAAARPLVMDALLQEYGLSTPEGVALMRLAEALIRTPDFGTARVLLRDKLAAGEAGVDWGGHVGQSRSALVNLATRGLQLTSAWIGATGGVWGDGFLARLGDRVLHACVVRAMGMMARHFVLGRTIGEATRRAGTAEAAGLVTHSYDMLGEAARTHGDAQAYFEAYLDAVTHLARVEQPYERLADAPGISVKLSALHPRYEWGQRHRCVPVLVERVKAIALIARRANVGLTIDAEECDRLEVSLLVFEQLARDPDLAKWDGLGLVVQAYQKRALPVVDRIIQTARTAGRRIAVRLVKGAYWDTEIKRAQELGLDSYPVFTRKDNTDLSYLACAQALLGAGDVIYPQFATHNAHSAAAVLAMARDAGVDFELQRLHGMGAALHGALMQSHGVRSRVYAPVGRHKELLPYLVRRLLENGANSSFVHQVLDDRVAVETVAGDPIERVVAQNGAAHPGITPPRDQFSGERRAAAGLDLTQSDVSARCEAHPASAAPVPPSPGASPQDTAGEDGVLRVTNPTRPGAEIGSLALSSQDDVHAAVSRAKASRWGCDVDSAGRAEVLDRAGDALEADMTDWLPLLIAEAGKTHDDAIGEVREAVDFLRYYASQARGAGLGGRGALGVVACISPWNFPLAIFLGQVAAALAVGNGVVAKPAEDTPLVAQRAVALLHAAGVPADALQLVVGAGDVGAALIAHDDVAGVCFTGSTATAKAIARSLAHTGRADIPLIAETGGLNAMVVDGTALLEQAVMDVVSSAFQSAGQRCSACRIVCVQDDIADAFNAMLCGAMEALVVGDPAQLDTDVGPLISAGARDGVAAHIAAFRARFPVVGEAPLDAREGHFVAPIAFEVHSLGDVTREIFGPVLHVVRYRAEDFDQVIADINALGFGLTMGLHTRIDARVARVANRARVGNIYVNRNQIGAVVGVQPFGGEGLSGTGPKAGGPHYLARLTRRHGEAALPDTSPQGSMTPTCLPGPVGEDNTLTLRPRGTVLCMGGDSPSHLERQIARALEAGNRVLGLRTETGAALPAGVVAVDMETAWSLLHQTAGETLHAVAIDGAGRGEVCALMCRRDGPIVPVLSAFDDVDRFCVERTVTVNIAAAGGNPSLLSLT